MNEVEILARKTCSHQRSTQLMTFNPCNPRTSHKHDEWSYDCCAWATIQEKTHVQMDGTLIDWYTTSDWDSVVAFYNKNKTVAYCSITAQRTIWTSFLDGSTQNVTLYFQCVGCECNAEDWVSLGKPTDLCTDAQCRPVFDREYCVSSTLSECLPETIEEKNLMSESSKKRKQDNDEQVEHKQTCTVIFNSDDGLWVMRVPTSVLATDVGKETILAITGDDKRFNPYTSEHPDDEFINKIYGTLKEWRTAYEVKPLFKDHDLVFGTAYI